MTVKIKKGSHRLVFMFGNYVVKCPRFDIIGTLLRERKVTDIIRYLRGGIAENWTEWKTWQRLKSCFLSPVILSFGVFNIQRRVKGEALTEDEWKRTMKEVSRIGRDVGLINLHFWRGEDNLLKTKSGIKIVDYGEAFFSKGIKIEAFLVRHQDELRKIFCP